MKVVVPQILKFTCQKLPSFLGSSHLTNLLSALFQFPAAAPTSQDRPQLLHANLCDGPLLNNGELKSLLQK